jgi:hypothetical protein
VAVGLHVSHPSPAVVTARQIPFQKRQQNRQIIEEKANAPYVTSA